MASYTIKNLKEDVEDSAVKFGFSPTLEARFARDDLEAEGLGISYQRVAPNEDSPFAHKHKEQPEEIYVIVGGSGQISVDGELQDVRPWDAIRVAGDAVRFWVAGSDGLELIAFGTSTGGNDAELVQPDAD